MSLAFGVSVGLGGVNREGATRGNGLRGCTEARSQGSGGHCESLVFYSEPGGCFWGRGGALSRGGPRSDSCVGTAVRPLARSGLRRGQEEAGRPVGGGVGGRAGIRVGENGGPDEEVAAAAERGVGTLERLLQWGWPSC